MAKLDEAQKLSLYMAYLTLRHEVSKIDNDEEVDFRFLWAAFRRLSDVLTDE